jgi:hypothetical protein
MNILKRPPGDQFTFRLFSQLISKIKTPKDAFYLWSMCFDPSIDSHFKYEDFPAFLPEHYYHENEMIYRRTMMNNIKHNTIVLGVKDHLTSRQFNPMKDRFPDMAIWLKQMANFYPDKHIILFTSLENLELDEPNMDIIPWGGDITNHQKEYLGLEPLAGKNYNSRYNYLSLNRHPRPHRIMLVSKLRDLKLAEHGLVSCMFKNQISGFEPTINDSYEIYNNFSNDNVNNFKNKLAAYYKETFVEIVAETSYIEPVFNLTEKTLNSIYGKSFPIFLSSAGTVEFLRSMGMDVFDDIVNHNYDKITDPGARLHRAITDNKELLTDNIKVKTLHQKNLARFNNNVDFAKNKMYNFYATRATEQFTKIINDRNL